MGGEVMGGVVVEEGIFGVIIFITFFIKFWNVDYLFIYWFYQYIYINNLIKC
jgi:hypothetical protein